MSSLWWLLVALLGVLFTKWYTSRQIQNLKTRISKLKKYRQESLDKKQEAKKRMRSAGQEQEEMESRVKNVKALIHDLEIRLERSQNEEDAAIMGHKEEEEAPPIDDKRKLVGLLMGR